MAPETANRQLSEYAKKFLRCCARPGFEVCKYDPFKALTVSDASQ
jgi:hypothetical protein